MTQIVADFGVLAHADYWKSGGLVFGAGFRPTPLFLSFKREADGREGAISGRLARKAAGVNPSGFAHTGVLAGKEGLPIFPEL